MAPSRSMGVTSAPPGAPSPRATIAGSAAWPSIRSILAAAGGAVPLAEPAEAQLTCRFPSSQNSARSLNFCNLPVAVRGSVSRNSTRLGHL